MFTSTSLQTRLESIGRGSSGRVQVFHDLTYAQAFTQVHTRSHIHTHTRTHTHPLSHINTQSAFSFLSPLGSGVFSFLLSLAHSVRLFLLYKKKAASFPGIGVCVFLLTPSLPLFFSFLLLLLLRVEQFVCLGVHGILHGLNFLFDLVGRVEAGAAQFAVDAF